MKTTRLLKSAAAMLLALVIAIPSAQSAFARRAVPRFAFDEDEIPEEYVCEEHDLTDSVIPPTCTEAGYTVHVCSVCGYSFTDSFVDATGHAWDGGTVAAEPTGTDPGEMRFTCSVCGAERTELLPNTGDRVPAPNGTRAGVVTLLWWMAGSPEPESDREPFEDVSDTDPFFRAVLWAVENRITSGTGPDTFSPDDACTRGQAVTFLWRAAGCPDPGEVGDPYSDVSPDSYFYAPVLWSVSAPGVDTSSGEEIFDPNGPVYGLTALRDEDSVRYVFHAHEWTETVESAVSCTEDGVTVRNCPICGATETETFPALGHDYGEFFEVSSPTCTENGIMKRVCARCGDEDIAETDALGHDYAYVVTPYTCTERGYTTHTCTRCGDEYVDTYLDALGHDFGPDGAAQTCARCGETNPGYRPPAEYSDVPEDAFFAAPVRWAVGRGITAGTGDSEFSPDDGCTRAQVVTFLWRAAGEPEPGGEEEPFRDVKKDDYFYKAVAWAVENDITAGTGAATFSPDDVCTRGQIVTFLWRYAGEPGTASSDNPFSDVSRDDYYFKAVLWAVEQVITVGTDADLFGPSDTCTRGQIVTFLFRYMR